MNQALSFLLLVSTLLHSSVAKYVLVDDYSGNAFWSGFSFFTDSDPTNGHVEFMSMAQANASGLVGFMSGGNASQALYMGVNSTAKAPTGRGAVRVQSTKTYQHALVLADIVHMPGGICGTWPAFWMVGDEWPKNGEIDIVEGVNDATSNQMTLHTGQGSVISNLSSSDTFTGRVLTKNCDVNAANQDKNTGCGIVDESGLTFGHDFNNNGGGVFAMEWTSTAIKIWFWPRGSFPGDLSTSPAQPAPSTESWGLPQSIFQGENANIDTHFNNLRLVFDTTFCGDWAGAVWNQSTTCSKLASSCEQYVSNNPKVFEEAYWAINDLMVWQDDGTGPIRTIVPGGSVKINHLADHAVQLSPGTRLAKPTSSTTIAEPTSTVAGKKHDHGAKHKLRVRRGGSVLSR